MNRYVYIIGIICVLFVIGALFIKLLPFLVFAGIAIYAITALKGKVAAKKEDDMKKGYGSYNSGNNNVEDIYNSSDDYTNGEIIDVDYEDVDKN